MNVKEGDLAMFPYLRTVKQFINDCEEIENGILHSPSMYSDVVNCIEGSSINKKCKANKCTHIPRLVAWLWQYCDLANWGKDVSRSELKSWCRSLCVFAHDVLDNVDENLVVGLECYLDNFSSRHCVVCDMIIGGYGKDESGNKCEKLLIMENKQWSSVEVRKTGKWCVKGIRNHQDNPADQVRGYKEALAKSINDGIGEEIEIDPCVYLHNLDSIDFQCDKKYWNDYKFKKDLSKKGIKCSKTNIGYMIMTYSNMNMFLKGSEKEFAVYIKKYFDHPHQTDCMEVFRAVKERFKTWKIDELARLLVDEKSIENEYIERLHPDQKALFEGLSKRIESKDKTVDLVDGAPGSGKTLIALLLMRKYDSKKNIVFAIRTNTQKNAYLDECIRQIGEKIKSIDPVFYKRYEKEIEWVVTNDKVVGLEYSDVLVIIGPDLIYDKTKRRVCARKKDAANEKYIKRAYRSVLTRGLKKIYIYVCDEELRKWIMKYQ